MAGTWYASSLLWPGCVPHLALASLGSGNGNLCAELWQDKWIPVKVFCQDLVGASSCFTAAVKHISAPSLCSLPPSDGIGTCGFWFVLVFFCMGVIFFQGFWTLVCETWNGLTPKLIPGLVRSISFRWTIFYVFYTQRSLQNAVTQQPAIFSSLSFMFSVGFEHLWKV